MTREIPAIIWRCATKSDDGLATRTGGYLLDEVYGEGIRITIVVLCIPDEGGFLESKAGKVRIYPIGDICGQCSGNFNRNRRALPGESRRQSTYCEP